MKLKAAILSAILASTPALYAHGQNQQTTQTPPPEPAKQNTGHSAAGEYGGAAGDAGKGAAKGVGSTAAGVGKGAGDVATLHPVKGAEAVGKGTAKGAGHAGVGAAKGTGKVLKGTGKILTHPF